MHNLDCDQDQMKLDEMSNEKLTKQIANRVMVICPLRIEVIWVIWKCNFDVFGVGFSFTEGAGRVGEWKWGVWHKD